MIIEGQQALEYVSHSIYNFGEVSPTDVLEFEIEWYKDKSDIDYIVKGCGCTSAYFEDGKIKGTLDMQKAGNFSNPGITPVQKVFTVWLNDGHSQFRAKNERLEHELNPEKGQIRVTLFARVNVPSDVMEMLQA